ncbi:MAG: RagB/SusD family nutrient uptake outer membrane protein [Bacteroidales bacterium]|nr:RagB/SusD family nutrient uptake outer membrane protein [Bacteroidales bacterium]
MSLKYIMVLISSLMLTSACEGFLDRQPYDSIDADDPESMKTEEDAIAAVNGAYQPLQWAKICNMRLWTLDIVAGNSEVGGGGGNDGIETKDMANFITKSDNAGVLDMYRGYPPGILRANLVLQKVPEMDIDSDIKNRCLGEAHFLRAVYNFYMVRLFGDIPLLTEPATIYENLKPSRSPVADVYELIIDDLTKAADLLPDASSYDEEDLGRASKGAALGFLAKVYLTYEPDSDSYAKVVDLCEQVTELGYYLNEDYADNFNPETKNGPESLFEVQYYGKTAKGFWDNETQCSWLSSFMGPRNSGMVAGAYGWNQPTAEFVNSYETDDLRKDVTILYPGCPSFDGIDYQSVWGTETGYNVRKFLVPKSIAPTYDSSPANFPLLRYADVLLMEAEALNELGRTHEAVEPLYQVRARAGLTDRTALESLSQGAMRNKIINERRIELAFEGQRWFDIIRLQNGEYARNWFASIGKTNFSDKFLLFPIPLKEIESNENLTQNTGY